VNDAEVIEAIRDLVERGEYRVQRDMGMGLSAYILALPRTAARPEEIDIFEPAQPSAIGTVAEQEKFFEAWRDSPAER
jgi:hypothetical protein